VTARLDAAMGAWEMKQKMDEKEVAAQDSK